MRAETFRLGHYGPASVHLFTPSSLSLPPSLNHSLADHPLMKERGRERECWRLARGCRRETNRLKEFYSLLKSLHLTFSPSFPLACLLSFTKCHTFDFCHCSHCLFPFSTPLVFHFFPFLVCFSVFLLVFPYLFFILNLLDFPCSFIYLSDYLYLIYPVPH